MYTDNLNVQLANLDSFIAMLKSLGIESNTRIHNHRKYLAGYISAIQNGTHKSLQETEEYNNFGKAFYEINQLVSIYSGLTKTNISENLIGRLKTYINGPINIDDENPLKSTNNPRDIGFELFLGATLLMGGYDIVFGNESDLEYQTLDGNYYIECKRPSSEKQISSNVAKAYSQLDKRYSSDAKGYGLVAISISKLVNKDHYTLRAPNNTSLDSQLRFFAEEFFKKHKSGWDAKRNEKTIGCLIYVDAPCYNEMDDSLSIRSYTMLVGFGLIETSQFKVVQSIFENIKPALTQGNVDAEPFLFRYDYKPTINK